MAGKKTIRRYGAPDLVVMFPKIVQGAHVNKGRDSRLLSQFMTLNGYDPVDVLWAYSRYAGAGARDIPSFIRWAVRADPISETSYELREAEVAEMLGTNRMPLDVVVYFDLEDDCCTAVDTRRLGIAAAALRAYVDPVLGPRYGETG